MVPDEAHAAARQAVSGPRLAMVTLPPPAPPTPPAPRVGPSPTLNPDTPLQVNRAAGTTVEDYLPAGSFVRGRLETPSKEAMEEVASTKARRKKDESDTEEECGTSTVSLKRPRRSSK